MAKGNTETQFLKLMETVRWEDKEDWTQESSQRKLAAIPAFKEWMKEYIQYLPEDIRVATENYYFNNQALNAYFLVDRGRSALAALYAAHQHFKMQYTMLINKLHDDAMAICDEADDALAENDVATSEKLFYRALLLEHYVAGATSVEPSRSIMYESAVNIALSANDRPFAMKIIDEFLSKPGVPEIEVRMRQQLIQLKERENVRRDNSD